MPGVPPCGLACRINKAHTFLKENKKSFLIYSIFYVLLAEVVSYFLRYEKNYACKIYPMLSNLEFFVLFFSLFLWNDRLHFCLRKNLAVLFLSVYFFFGFIALAFNFQDSTYTFWISIGLLSISVTTFILSIFKSE